MTRPSARAPSLSARGVPGGWGQRFASPLPRSFFDRETERVARELLGQVLLRREGRRWRAARIVETEAYLREDPASHAYRGPTPRNRSMFSDPGTLYVFRIHQVHCINAVTRPGEAVLLRAAEPLNHPDRSTRGPGRLAGAFGLTRQQDGADLLTGEVRIVRGEPPPEPVVRDARVGISKARELPLRFALEGNPWVSGPRPWAARSGAQRSLAQL